MPDIYSTDWYDALRDALNRSPEVAKTAPPGELCILAEIQGDGGSPYVPEGSRLRFVVSFVDGKCAEYVETQEPPARENLDFTFEIPAGVFEGIAAGTVDPIEAGLKGAIKITGDMRILLRHAEFVNALEQVYASEVETSWPLGKPSHLRS